MNAEYFLETVEHSKDQQAFFEVKQNPFRFDALGKAIDFKTDGALKALPKSLLLSPELLTMREMSWQKKEALVMADAYDPETKQLVPFAPRNILKNALNTIHSENSDLMKDITSQIMFSFVLQKFGKSEKEQHQAQNRGLLTMEQGGWSDVLNDCKRALHNIGIPVQSKDQT